MKKENQSIYRITFTAVMAAIVCVVTFLRFPLLGSKVHFANAMCLLSGMLLGPVFGGLAAGLGSALYDALFGGYDLANCVMLAQPKKEGKGLHARVVLGSVAGALSYVVLYMLKTFIYQSFVYGYPMDTTWATMLSKLPASLINAVAAFIAAPILYAAVRPALKNAGLLKKL